MAKGPSLLHSRHPGLYPHSITSLLSVSLSQNILAQAKKNYPDVQFAVGDAWRTAELSRIRSRLLPVIESEDAWMAYTAEPARGVFDVVFVDVGGLSGSDGLLESLSLLDGLSFALEPRVIVIKSLCMRRLASSLRPFAKLWWAARESAGEAGR